MDNIKLNKQVSHAFNKDVYLLGSDKQGIRYWLEQATWDCDWYWGFGYVKTYQSNRLPSKAVDIDSHQHFNGLWNAAHADGYRHKLSDMPGFISVLTKDEEWRLAELMQLFYNSRNAAETLNRGSAGISTIMEIKDKLKNREVAKEINEKKLPLIFAEVYKLLTPAI